MSKPRADGVLSREPQRAALVEWFTQENLSYPEALVRLKEKFGIESSVSSLCRFFQSECLVPSLRGAREFADQVAEEMRRAPDKFDEATIRLVSKRAFVLASAPGSSVKDLKTLAGIVGSSKKLALQERQLGLEVEKFKEQAKSKIDAGLEELGRQAKGNKKVLALLQQVQGLINGELGNG